MSLVVRGETLDDAQSNWARKRASGQAGGWKGELVPDKGELSGKAMMVMTEMARRARIMARRRRHIPPITDENFKEEWAKFEMDLEASEDEDIAKYDIAKAEAKAKANNNQLKIKAGKGRVSPEGMQDLAALLDDDQPKGKGGGSREDPAHAGMEEIGLLAGNGGDLIRRWLL